MVARRKLGEWHETVSKLVPQIRYWLRTGFVAAGKIINLHIPELYSVVRGKVPPVAGRACRPSPCGGAPGSPCHFAARATPGNLRSSPRDEPAGSTRTVNAAETRGGLCLLGPTRIGLS